MVSKKTTWVTEDGREFEQQLDADLWEREAKLEMALHQLTDIAPNYAENLLRAIKTSYDLEQRWSDWLGTWSMVRGRNAQTEQIERIRREADQ